MRKSKCDRAGASRQACARTRCRHSVPSNTSRSEVDVLHSLVQDRIDAPHDPLEALHVAELPEVVDAVDVADGLDERRPQKGRGQVIVEVVADLLRVAARAERDRSRATPDSMLGRLQAVQDARAGVRDLLAQRQHQGRHGGVRQAHHGHEDALLATVHVPERQHRLLGAGDPAPVVGIHARNLANAPWAGLHSRLRAKALGRLHVQADDPNDHLPHL
mmetsp:Transcript_137843/g.428339  ORF Transcript_137843/g.428339 Transcript_137843/m.428339 type:complete len:218 (-) Transcript_137843:615-1268(-)